MNDFLLSSFALYYLYPFLCLASLAYVWGKRTASLLWFRCVVTLYVTGFVLPVLLTTLHIW